MEDFQAQVDKLVNKLQVADSTAQQSVQALSEQAQPWDADKGFVRKEIHPILGRWYKLLNTQISRLSTGREMVGSLLNAIKHANAFINSLPYQPKIILKQTGIALIATLSWLKQILFMLIRLAILAVIIALILGLLYLIFRLGQYLLDLLGDAFKNLIQQIKGLF